MRSGSQTSEPFLYNLFGAFIDVDEGLQEFMNSPFVVESGQRVAEAFVEPGVGYNLWLDVAKGDGFVQNCLACDGKQVHLQMDKIFLAKAHRSWSSREGRGGPALDVGVNQSQRNALIKLITTPNDATDPIHFRRD